MRIGEAASETIGFMIDEKINISLTIEHDIFGTMPRHRTETHDRKEIFQGMRIRGRVFDELKAIGPHGIFDLGHTDTSLDDAPPGSSHTEPGA